MSMRANATNEVGDVPNTGQHRSAIRLFVADDHPILLSGLESLFRSTPGYTVVGTATNGDDALAAIVADPPDIAILDLRMPGKTGLEVAAGIFGERLRTRVILLAAALTDDEVVEAVRLGVHGVVLKGMATTLLLTDARRIQ